MAAGQARGDLGHEGLEVAARDLATLLEHAAAHDVEEGVGEVACVLEGAPRSLQPVGARHEARELPRVVLRVLVQVGGGDRSRAQVALEAGHRRGVLLDLGDEGPAPRLPGAERQIGAHQIGPAHPAHVLLRLDRAAPPEGLQLALGQENAGVVEAVAPHRVHSQGLAGLGSVHGDRAQAVEGQARVATQLRALVGVHERAVVGLHPRVHARGQQVEEAVEHLHLNRLAALLEQLDSALEAEPLPAGPGGAEGEAQGEVALLEDEARPGDVLAEAALDGVEGQLAGKQRLPERGHLPAPDAQDRARTTPA